MWIYIVLFVISAALVFGLGSCIPSKDQLGGFKENDSLFYPSDSSFGKASRADVEMRLKTLAESEVPPDLHPGAMCYEMSEPPDSIAYICNQCGEKTLYSNTEEYYLVENVQDARNMVASIRNLDLRLEESNFCHKCSADTSLAPEYKLFIKYKGEETEEYISNPSPESIQLIYEFMNGDKTHSYFNEREEPLKEYIDRLSALLKVNISKP